MGSESSIIKCHYCDKLVPSYDVINLVFETETVPICLRCKNENEAQMQGLSFKHWIFAPFTCKDNEGNSHQFIFRTNLIFDKKIGIEALEIINGELRGFNFGIIGSSEEDILNLFKTLLERIRKGINQKHIEKRDGKQFQITDHDTVRAQIQWDDETDGELPLLVIDGKEISWHELGMMLMSYEGFKFKMEIFDRTEER